MPGRAHTEFAADETVKDETEQSGREADAGAERVEHALASALLILKEEDQTAGETGQDSNEEDDDQSLEKHAEGPTREPVNETSIITHRLERMPGQTRLPL